MIEASSNSREILWKTRTTRVSLQMTIYGKRERVHLTKDVIRVLGVPNYICVKVNNEWNSIVVMPCADKEYLSFKVPNGILLGENKKMEFRSKAFTDTLLERNGLEQQGTYIVPCLYLERHNVLVFDFKDVELYGKHDESG